MLPVHVCQGASCRATQRSARVPWSCPASCQRWLHSSAPCSTPARPHAPLQPTLSDRQGDSTMHLSTCTVVCSPTHSMRKAHHSQTCCRISAILSHAWPHCLAPLAIGHAVPL